MQITPGLRLAQYEIASDLGRGGMGAVYRARDTKLGRDVALKLLPDEFIRDADRLARFDREARVLASLNHPHVASIHDFSEIDGAKFLVMELVQGETLESRLRGGALPIDEAVAITKQIAEGLHAAHEKGIVHRDLKPANIMITEDGAVKILDFGLARSDDTLVGDSDPTNSPTLARLATHAGVILGTAAYMSPEQARGRRVDKRSDVWSLGVILWEMLAGRRMFSGETVSDILASVLTGKIDFGALPAETPPNVVWILQRCLARDPKRRFHDAADVSLALDAEPMVAATPAAVAATRPPWWLYVIGLVALASSVAVAALWMRGEARAPQPLHAAILLPSGTRAGLTGVQPGPPVISPDSRFVVLAADEPGKKRRLWIRDLVKGESRWLEGTEGASYPFWSPDGQHIGFFADDRLKRIPASGGTAVALANASNAKGGSWGNDDVILFAPMFNSAIFRVSATGGPATPATTVDVGAGDSGHRFPQFLDDGKSFVYLARRRGDGGHRMVIGSLDDTPSRPIIDLDNHAFVAGGHLFFERDGNLMVQAFDQRSGSLSGAPLPIASHIRSIPGASRLVADASTDVVLFQRGQWQRAAQLLWVDRSGNSLGDIGEPADYQHWTVSPDGRSIAVRITQDLWLVDPASGNRERLTFDANVRSQPVWSPDGRRLAFAYSSGSGSMEILSDTIPSSGKPEVLVSVPEANRFLRPSSWSPDGKILLYEDENVLRNTTTILMLDLTKKEPAVPLMEGPARFPQARFSPNGRWIAFGSANTEGRPTVYVVAYPQVTRRWEIGSGHQPFWRSDGTELYFQDIDGRVQAVPLRVNTDSFAWGQLIPLFQASSTPVSRDGERFLVLREVDDGTAEPIELVVNWRGLVETARDGR